MNYGNKYVKYKSKYFALKKQLQIGGVVKKENTCMDDCINLHSSNGKNYEWLNSLGYGKVVKVEFEEPINSGNWRLYTDEWWGVHCKVISHDPDDLVEAHVKAFINPLTRFARKRFTFKNGEIMEPTIQFYELEQEYFAKKYSSDLNCLTQKKLKK